MNKKTAGRISAMAMASMMMMSVCVVNASAEENEPITQLNLKKTVKQRLFGLVVMMITK